MARARRRVIVGHPGETEADFQATLALVRNIGFAQAFSFKYSPRPGTPASGAPSQVSDAEKGERLAEIELTEIDAQVAQVRALGEKAQRDLERGERLYADQVISLESNP